MHPNKNNVSPLSKNYEDIAVVCNVTVWLACMMLLKLTIWQHDCHDSILYCADLSPSIPNSVGAGHIWGFFGRYR